MCRIFGTGNIYVNKTYTPINKQELDTTEAYRTTHSRYVDEYLALLER
jgi:hypothetical protein